MYSFPDFHDFDQQICHFLQNHKNLEFLIFSVSISKIYELLRLTLPHSKVLNKNFSHSEYTMAQRVSTRGHNKSAWFFT